MITKTKTTYIKYGVLEVFCGPMKSGKTKELLNIIDKIKYIENSNYLFVKPKLDTRDILSRNKNLDTNIIFIDENNPNEIFKHIKNDTNVILFDESQFYKNNIIDIIKELLSKDIYIVIAGLDLDFRGETFGEMGNILALADEVHKLTAICEYQGCSQIANRTQRFINNKPAPYDSPIILIGDEEEGYSCRCIEHHIINKTN